MMYAAWHHVLLQKKFDFQVQWIYFIKRIKLRMLRAISVVSAEYS